MTQFITLLFHKVFEHPSQDAYLTNKPSSNVCDFETFPSHYLVFTNLTKKNKMCQTEGDKEIGIQLEKALKTKEENLKRP